MDNLMNTGGCFVVVASNSPNQNNHQFNFLFEKNYSPNISYSSALELQVLLTLAQKNPALCSNEMKNLQISSEVFKKSSFQWTLKNLCVISLKM